MRTHTCRRMIQMCRKCMPFIISLFDDTFLACISISWFVILVPFSVSQRFHDSTASIQLCPRLNDSFQLRSLQVMVRERWHAMIKQSDAGLVGYIQHTMKRHRVPFLRIGQVAVYSALSHVRSLQPPLSMASLPGLLQLWCLHSNRHLSKTRLLWKEVLMHKPVWSSGSLTCLSALQLMAVWFNAHAASNHIWTRSQRFKRYVVQDSSTFNELSAIIFNILFELCSWTVFPWRLL